VGNPGPVRTKLEPGHRLSWAPKGFFEAKFWLNLLKIFVNSPRAAQMVAPKEISNFEPWEREITLFGTLG
jgi:hypothetical protein